MLLHSLDTQGSVTHALKLAHESGLLGHLQLSPGKEQWEEGLRVPMTEPPLTGLMYRM